MYKIHNVQVKDDRVTIEVQTTDKAEGGNKRFIAVDFFFADERMNLKFARSDSYPIHIVRNDVIDVHAIDRKNINAITSELESALRLINEL